MITSCGSRWWRWWRKRLALSGRAPEEPVQGRGPGHQRWPAATPADVERGASTWTASSSRAAALPVGAARPTSGGGRPRPSACSSSRATIRPTVGGLAAARTTGDDATGAGDGRGGGPPCSTAPSSERAAAASGQHRSRPPGPDRTGPGQKGVGHGCARPASSGRGTGRVPTNRSGRSSGPSSPAATSGLAARRVDPVSGSGQGRAPRSSSSSSSVAAVARTVSEVDVDVPDPGSPHGQGDRQRHPLVGSAPSCASRVATCTSAAPSTPARLKARKGPAAVAATSAAYRPGRGRGMRSAITWGRSVVEEVRQRQVDQRRGGRPGEHPARDRRPTTGRLWPDSSRGGTGRGRRPG